MSNEDSHYILCYWDIRGLAEVCRLILNYGNLPYKMEHYKLLVNDKRKFIGNDWGAVEKQIAEEDHAFVNMPYLKLPADGKKPRVILTQSNAIVRYLAAKTGLVATSPEAQAFADEIHEHLIEMKDEANHLSYRTDDFARDQGLFRDKSVSYYIGKLEERLAQRSAAEGGKEIKFVAGDEVTYVDLYLFEVCQLCEVILCANKDGTAPAETPSSPLQKDATTGIVVPRHLLADAPRVSAIFERVHKLPQLQGYFTDKEKGVYRVMPFNGQCGNFGFTHA